MQVLEKLTPKKEIKRMIVKLEEYYKNNLDNKVIVKCKDLRDDEISLTQIIKELDENYYSVLHEYEEIEWYNYVGEVPRFYLVSNNDLRKLRTLLNDIQIILEFEKNKFEKNMKESTGKYKNVLIYFNYDKYSNFNNDERYKRLYNEARYYRLYNDNY